MHRDRYLKGDVAKSAAAVVIGGVVALILGEVLVRVTAPVPVRDVRSVSGRLHFSTVPLELRSDGVVRYVPGATIREVAVYGEKIEWDITYRINAQGFRDGRDYPHESKIAFVGDSYTAAAGGADNWVAELGVYNLGIGGAGIEMMENLIRGIEWPVRDIYVILISGDFLRSPWTPRVKEGRFGFCGNSQIKGCFEATLGELRLTPSDEAVTREAFPQQTSILKSLKSIVLVKRTWDRLLRKSWVPIDHFSDIEAIDRNRAALRRLVADRRVKGVIQLPQREEISIGRYLVDGSVEGADYYPALYRCGWSQDMYYTHDPHPNDDGYRNIRECVRRYLLSAPTRTSSETLSRRLVFWARR